ncbi:MAG: hypothetical protein IPF99_41870 [Deltaproteobacteria bacterium]|nr:hypothetical protein [Deltaproteobacteria bacterium]
MVLRTTFGVLLGEDDGRRWSWMWEDAFGYGRPDVWDRRWPSAPGARRRPAAAGASRAGCAAPDACGSTAVPEVGGDYTADLSATGTGALHRVGSS